LDKFLSCIYVNAHSIIKKVDSLQTVARAFQPDTIGITESWTNSDIADAELMVPGYDLFRKDRPVSSRGGGVLLYVKSIFHAVEYRPRTAFPEHIWCTLDVDGGKNLLVGVCYRTPNNDIFNFDNNRRLNDLIVELGGSEMLLLMGDFNYPDINWEDLSASSVTSQMFVDSLEDHFLVQHVKNNTRKDSLLDLVITSEPDMVDTVNVLGNFATSDHQLLQWTLNVKSSGLASQHLVLDYAKADYVTIKSELSTTCWSEILRGDAEQMWSTFRDTLTELMNTHVPRRILKDGINRKPQWMSYKALRLIKRKHRLYAKYKDNKHPAYMKAAREANTEIKRSKRRFEKKLAENIKSDVKSFFSYARNKSQTRSGVGPIRTESGELVSSPADMVDVLNKYFSSVFTKESNKPHPSVEYLPDINDGAVLRDIHISEDIVSKKLDLMRDDKSGGPDDLSPRFLNRIKDEICVPLTMIFRQSLDEGVVPVDWRTANVSPIYKKGDNILLLQGITDQSA